MNRKKYIGMLGMVTAIALCMSLFLLGCGSSGGSNGSASHWGADAAAPQAAPEPSPSSVAMDYSYNTNGAIGGAYERPEEDVSADAPVTSSTEFVMPDSRKIIRHLSMDLETREFAEALESIKAAVAGAGGYIESQNQEGYSLGSRSRYQERYANIQARVPSGKLDEVARSVGGFCNVLSQSENMDDITDSYYDAQAHLNTLRVQEERLLAILEKAEKLEDVITLESALSDVRYQIESLTAALRRMDSQVTYSYLNISLREVVEYQEIQEKPRTFGERMNEAFGDGLGDMVDGLEGFALFLARRGPSLAVLILFVVVIVVIIRVLTKASEKRRAAKGLPAREPRPTYSGMTQGPRFERYPSAPQRPQPPVEEKPQQESQDSRQ